jgi:hypothetical protein
MNEWVAPGVETPPVGLPPAEVTAIEEVREEVAELGVATIVIAEATGEALTQIADEVTAVENAAENEDEKLWLKMEALQSELGLLSTRLATLELIILTPPPSPQEVVEVVEVLPPEPLEANPPESPTDPQKLKRQKDEGESPAPKTNRQKRVRRWI